MNFSKFQCWNKCELRNVQNWATLIRKIHVMNHNRFFRARLHVRHTNVLRYFWRSLPCIIINIFWFNIKNSILHYIQRVALDYLIIQTFLFAVWRCYLSNSTTDFSFTELGFVKRRFLRMIVFEIDTFWLSVCRFCLSEPIKSLSCRKLRAKPSSISFCIFEALERTETISILVQLFNWLTTNWQNWNQNVVMQPLDHYYWLKLLELVRCDLYFLVKRGVTLRPSYTAAINWMVRALYKHVSLLTAFSTGTMSSSFGAIQLLGSATRGLPNLTTGFSNQTNRSLNKLD